MSKSETLQAFEQALKNSAELRESFIAAQKRIAESKEAASTGELLVKAAAEVGFTLTLEELERSFAAAQELSEEELKAVVGGGEDHSDEFWCVASYYCYWVYKHTEDGNDDRPCWNDYYCAIAVNYDPEYVM